MHPYITSQPANVNVIFKFMVSIRGPKGNAKVPLKAEQVSLLMNPGLKLDLNGNLTSPLLIGHELLTVHCLVFGNIQTSFCSQAGTPRSAALHIVQSNLKRDHGLIMNTLVLYDSCP